LGNHTGLGGFSDFSNPDRGLGWKTFEPVVWNHRFPMTHTIWNRRLGIRRLGIRRLGIRRLEIRRLEIRRLTRFGKIKTIPYS
jgi:hypothetical protein